MAYQSLYRRYRSRTFAEIRGQDHVVSALRNAVASGTEGHAYLFSGPRGTGKTSTARIFAKALNCTDLHNGEPCLECDSCLAIEAGSSYDLFELDAASNSGVDAMRELIGRSIVASPGRTKVYILDEVHMLTPGASNALLKTLEEPPDHVKFVLATTDPHKVLPTIRSRTQHFEFNLIPAEVLADHVRWVIADAGLAARLGDGVEDVIAYVVREGRGSARDTLSALDRVVAAGGLVGTEDPSESVLEAIAGRDVGAAIAAVAGALDRGRDPRVLGEAALASLRNAFLLSIGIDVPQIADGQRGELTRLASEIGTPTLTRSLEAIGQALVEMRQAPDPRVPLEVALIRVCDPTTDLTLAGLADRIDRLERGAPVAGSSAPAAPASPVSSSPVSSSPVSPSPVSPSPVSPTGPTGAAGAARAREELARQRPARSASRPAALPAAAPAARAPAAPAPAAPPKEPASTPVTSAGDVGVVALTEAMPVLTARLKGVARAIYGAGRFAAFDGSVATFVLENAPTRDRAERARAEVERALSEQLGRPVTLRLIEEAEAGAGSGAGSAAPSTASGPAGGRAEGRSDEEAEEAEETIELDELVPADVATSVVDKLAAHFPGATMIDEETP